MKYYKVARLIFAIDIKDNDPLLSCIGNYAPFEIDPDKDDGVACRRQCLFTLQVEPPEQIPANDTYPDGQSVLPEAEPFADFEEPDMRLRLYKSADKEPAAGQDEYDYNILFTLPGADGQYAYLKTKNLFTQAVLIAKGTTNTRRFGLNNALMVLFAFTAARHRVVLQHASVIKKDGKGYLFLGKSGTGKSTHSRLWLKYIEGTTLLNDDNPALRLDNNGKAFVFGSPWSGKTPCYKNDCASIGGFVKLSQAPCNKIERLGVIAAYAALYPTVSNLKWESFVNNYIHETINTLAETVPVFALDCLPDREAALMSSAALGAGVTPDSAIAAHTAAYAPEDNVHVMRNEDIFTVVGQLVKEGREVVLKVKGNSMLPFIIDGENVTLKKQDSYKKKDIVLAHLENGHYVLHRIDAIKGEEITLRGDGNISNTEQCKAGDIIAKAISIEHKGRITDPYGSLSMFRFNVWNFLLPVRRYLLGIYRRLPQNRARYAVKKNI